MGRSFDLKRHISRVHNRFPCEICNQVFFRDYELKSHLSDVHSISTFNSEAFTNLMKMGSLEGKPTEGKPINGGQNHVQCHLCKAFFTTQSNLRSHTRQVHERDKPYQCTYCNHQTTRKFDM